MATIKKCKYCLKPLDDEGFCSKPCKMGALIKKKAELEKAIAEKKKASENNG